MKRSLEYIVFDCDCENEFGLFHRKVKELSFVNYHKLKLVKFNADGFRFVTDISFDNNPLLTSIEIGKNCCNINGEDGYLLITDCDMLESVILHENACQFFTDCDLISR